MRALWRRSDDRADELPREPEHVSLIDPGTGTVRAAVARIGEGEASVLGWGEAPADGFLDSEIQLADPAALARACGAALTAAEAMATERARGRVRPTRAIVGLPAAWLWGGEHVHSQTRIRSEAPIDSREVRGLLARAHRATEALALDRLGLPGAVVKMALVDMQIDGRRVSDPEGFRGEMLTCTLFAAAAGRATVRTWRLAGESLGLERITLVPAAMAAAHCLPDGDSLVLDVGFETTELMWLCRGNPLRLGSVPVGGRAMTQSLQDGLGLSVMAATYLKHQYAAGRVDAERRAQVELALIPALQAWYDQVQLGLSSMARGDPLPASVVLMGQAARLPEVADGARALIWSERLRFFRYPQVRMLQPTDVPHAFDRTGQGLGVASIPLLALASWVATEQTMPATRPGACLDEMSR